MPSEQSTLLRRACGLVLLLVLAAPPVAHADHFVSPAGDRVIDPTFTVGPEIVTPGQLVNLALTTSLPDRHNPIVRTRYILPAEWQFAVGTIRRGNKADGTPADTCAEVQHISYGDTDFRNAAEPAPRAEPVSVNEFLTIATTRSRQTTMAFNGSEFNAQIGPGSYPNTKSIRFGRDNAPDIRGGRLVFLKWDQATQTATLCQYFHERDGRLDQEALPGVYDRSAREHLMPLTLRRLPDLRWEIAFDYLSFLNHPYLRSENVSVLFHYLEIPSHTYGNWQANCSDTALCPEGTPDQRAFILAHQTAFNRAPSTPGTYEVRAAYTTCSLDEVGVQPACQPGTEETVERLSSIVVANEDPTVHTYGRLVGAALPDDRYYIALGNKFQVLWRAPIDIPALHTIKGYLLTVARANREETRHFQYMVTDPEHPTFDPRQPCGTDGNAGTCSLMLNFPLSTLTPMEPLTANGKYVISIVTIYDDGHRSDGKCDDGTPEGISCPAHLANFGLETGLKGSPPGIDFKELLIRNGSWGQVFVETVNQANGVGNPNITVPSQVLLVDYVRKRAEMIVWSWNSPKETSYLGSSITTLGDPSTGTGLVSFQAPPRILDQVTTVIVATTQFLAQGISIYTDIPQPGGRMPSVGFRPFNQARRVEPYTGQEL